ncbi:MAG TPA: CocE/NonD family hydrolase [Candidatus Aquilonibacter sp.]|nr:CocE/NonD family hydrolase [Candidatus Aquilonibacter sp.]
MKTFCRVLLAGTVLATTSFCVAQQQSPLPKDDLTPNFKAPAVETDYIKRVEMIPMRDGVKLYTVIVIPKGVHDAPILLTRTPYNAAARAERTKGAARMVDLLPLSDEDFVKAGYIRVYQDVRGKYGSEGVYLMTPPPVNSGYNPSGADDTTDAYDTIDWLVKNVPESNGRVGMIGSSYEGFTVVMALLHPHPALKVTAPESPMVDGWMGDDWFHYGAFREPNLDYFTEQTTKRGQGAPIHREHRDDYTNFLEAGSAGDFARAGGLDQLPFWHVMEEHPAYDGYWQSQALDKLIAKTPLTVPTMWEQGEWDQEDMYGGNHAYRAWEPQDKTNTMNFLVMGPWFHSQINRQGRGIGPFEWSMDTSEYWRKDILLPFFNQYLKPGSPKADTPPVLMYDAGLDKWDRMQAFPVSCESGCEVRTQPLYLRADGGLSFEAPAKPDTAKREANDGRFDEYVSDPAKPVPFSPRPYDGSNWRTWLVTDQRFVDGRPDVLTYVSEPLTKPMKLAGEPIVHLMASTSGTDSDWVVKLIDVYPDSEVKAGDAGGVFPGVIGTPYNMSGYELPIGIDIFRGRYRTSFEHPEAIKPNEPLEYKFALPLVNRTILPGHRLMVQVQSTAFPLYDRNPQTFVPNIFDAKPGDYQRATQRVWHEPGEASYISLPVVPISQ